MKIRTSLGVYAYLICTLLPAVSYLTGGYLLMAICAFVLVAFWQHHGAKGKLPLLLAPFLCLYLADICSELFAGSFSVVGAYSKLVAYLPVLLFLVVSQCKEKVAVRLTWLLTILHLVVAVSSIVVLADDPNAARYLATGQKNDYTDSLYLRNTADYSIVYTQVISLPLIAYASREKVLPWWVFAGYVVAVSAMVIYANYAMAIILLVVALFACALPRKMRSGHLAFVIIITVLVVWLLPGVIAYLIEIISSQLTSQNVINKLNDIATMLRGEELQTENMVGRMELYNRSWELFLSSPIFGNWYKSGIYWGGHSFLLDTMAKYGIVGVCLLGWIYSSIYKFAIAPYKHEDAYVPLVMSLILGIIVSAVNTGLWINVSLLYAGIILKATRKREST